MTFRRPISTSLAALAVVTLTGAAWSWWGAAAARAPLTALASDVQTLQREADRLAALPDLPELPPLPQTLSSFLGALPSTLAVKFTAHADKTGTALKDVPNMTGVRLVVLEVADPHPVVDLPQQGLTTVAGWQGRWPLQVTRAVWNGRALVTTLTLYGR